MIGELIWPIGGVAAYKKTLCWTFICHDNKLTTFQHGVNKSAVIYCNKTMEPTNNNNEDPKLTPGTHKLH